MSTEYEKYEQVMKNFSLLNYTSLSRNFYDEFFRPHSDYFTLDINDQKFQRLINIIDKELLDLARSHDVCTMINKIKNEDIKESAKGRIFYIAKTFSNRDIFEIILSEVCVRIIKLKLETLALIVTEKSYLSEIDGEYDVLNKHLKRLELI